MDKFKIPNDDCIYFKLNGGCLRKEPGANGSERVFLDGDLIVNRIGSFDVSVDLVDEQHSVFDDGGYY